MEVAVILPGNHMKGKLNPKQTQIMVDFACRQPKQNAEAIQNGGRQILGLDPPQNAVMVSARFEWVVLVLMVLRKSLALS